jgi:ABC-type Fe3+/spermidine/putrescine transport system ATPase subunit
MAHLSLQDICKEFGTLQALDHVELEISDGEFFSVLGPSGCGKTTLLRLIAGFERPSAGRILLDGRDITGVEPKDRHIGMVFQNYALFPHMTVADNVAFGLRARGVPVREIHARVDQAIATVDLEPRRDTPVPLLSGGEQQRVAVARALVLQPSVLLFDEPLSNLDLSLRLQMREEIRTLQRRTHITTVYVTHDQSEAMSLSDRIGVLRSGSLQQVGTPVDVYRSPATPFVAQFLGSASLLEGEWTDGGGKFRTGVIDLPVPENRRTAREGPCVLAVKPEAVRLSPPDAPGMMRGMVENCEYLGPVTTARVRIGDVHLQATILNGMEVFRWAPGSEVAVSLDWHGCTFFDREPS